MRIGLARRTAVLLGVGALLAVPALAGCGSSSDNGSADSNKKITLTVNLFGDFGYKKLYEQYQQAHPNITIMENVTDYNTHHQNLQAHLLAGAGTADIEAIEIGQVAGYANQASKFVNFLDNGVTTDQWVDSKWQMAASPDKKTLFGLGTDMGGLALCYRSDMFAAAGLPTAPADVDKLINSWDDYVNVGKQFVAKYPDKNVKWYDAASNVFNAILFQAQNGVYDDNQKIDITTNPAVKAAWDQTVASIKAGESAGVGAFTTQWNQGFANGQWATVTCPAWMLAEIKQQGPNFTGKWNVAAIPGTHGGNWGGSYLTVPKQGKNIAAAVDLAKFLTAPDQEKFLFTNVGNFPSDKVLWTDPAVSGYTDPYFQNAPLGKIFSDSAINLKPQPTGPHAGEIGNAIGNGLVSLEQGKATPDAAWAKVLADVQNLAG
jgi:cellobiose transport system substrate-binding protein